MDVSIVYIEPLSTENQDGSADTFRRRALIGLPGTQEDMIAAVKRVHMSALDEFRDQAHMEKDAHLAVMYWFMTLYVELHFWTLTQPTALFYPIKRILQLLNGGPQIMASPLSHHYAGLVAHVLCQLADFVDTRDEAIIHLETLLTTLDTSIHQSDTTSVNTVIRDTVARKQNEYMNSQPISSPTMGPIGLEHLANAAVNSTDPSKEVDVDNNGIAAAAEAAAKAAQAQIGKARQSERVDKKWAPELMSQDGYLAGLPQ